MWTKSLNCFKFGYIYEKKSYNLESLSLPKRNVLRRYF